MTKGKKKAYIHVVGGSTRSQEERKQRIKVKKRENWRGFYLKRKRAKRV